MTALVRRFLWMLLAADGLIIAANVAFDVPSFFDLDEERNFTTWYSSAKLLLAALAALACAIEEPPGPRSRSGRSVWVVVALLLAGLSMDETATAHERLAALAMKLTAGESLRERLLGGDPAKDAFAWPVLFAPVIVAMLGFLVHALYSRLAKNRTSLVLGLAGCLCLAAALILEGPMVYLSPPVEAWGAAEMGRYRLFTFFEESAEVFGTTLILAALLLHAALVSRPRSR